MPVKIFKLALDTYRDSDPAYDAVMIPDEGSEKFRYYFSNPNLYGLECLPTIIYFLANFKYIPSIDVPFTDSGLFIISEKFINLLYEYVFLDFSAVPVVMIDDTFLDDKFDSERELLKDVPSIDSYFAVRLGKLKSYFDFENSEFRPMRSNPKIPGRIKNLVLKEPEEGFPSLFRTIEASSTIFITSELKSLLEENKIQGCKFEEVEVTPYREETA